MIKVSQLALGLLLGDELSSNKQERMNKHLFIQLYGMIKKSIRNSVAIGSVGLSSLATNTVVSAAESRQASSEQW